MNQNENLKFKLIYFEERGKSDLIKLLLSYLNQTYEDIKIKPNDWNYYKCYMPFESLPVLVINDNLKLCQAITISRFLAKHFNLNGSNEIEAIECDMIVEQLRECADHSAQINQENDLNKRNLLASKFLNDVLPKTLAGLEKILSLNSSKYVVGDKLTWADLALVNAWEWLDSSSKQMLNFYPFVKAHNEFIRNIPKISEWFKSQKPLRVFKNV
nr:glutathione S-transferase GSTS5 [Brachionus angularis]